MTEREAHLILTGEDNVTRVTLNSDQCEWLRGRTARIRQRMAEIDGLVKARVEHIASQSELEERDALYQEWQQIAAVLTADARRRYER